ncbi:MAG: GAP family protein [Thermomicrobiales bacterium]|nr:GAP family protein [Thermomicrobiales bacterium]
MGVSIGDILPMAVIVASSPIQIIAILVLLSSARGTSAAPAFTFGWLLGLAVVGGVTLLLADPARADSRDEPSTVGAILQLALGLLLLFMAYRQWAKRPKGDEPPKSPKWMAGMESAGTAKAALIGFLLAAISPKITLFTISAAITIVQTGVSFGGAAIALAVFIAIASITVIVPVVWSLTAPRSAARALGGLHGWLVSNSAIVMTVLFLYFGANLIGKGISGLSI